MFPLPLVYSPDYVTPLPPDHRFPMPKFGKVYDSLIRDGIASLDQFHLPATGQPEAISLVHDRAYVDAYLQGGLSPKAMRRIGFPWSASLAQRTCAAVGGTLLTAQLALIHGMACNTAGGTHHAFPDFGSGFCIFNDVAIAIRHSQESGQIRRALVVDLDVHQGDGTAFIFQDDPDVFTFSMHCEKNFPFRKQRGSLDVGLPTGMQDEAYLHLLRRHLPAILDDFRPELVFYNAGVDPHAEDSLGKLALSDAGLYARDHYVLSQCWQRQIPVAGVIGGGYHRDHQRLAQRHTLLHQAASGVMG
jgi:acetoin utilization deacetylase AcuC-like enzyme